MIFYRPFKCDKCEQGFYRNNILKEHIARCTAQPSEAADVIPEEVPYNSTPDVAPLIDLGQAAN